MVSWKLQANKLFQDRGTQKRVLSLSIYWRFVVRKFEFSEVPMKEISFESEIWPIVDPKGYLVGKRLAKNLILSKNAQGI